MAVDSDITGVKLFISSSRKGQFPCHINQPEKRNRKLSNFLHEVRITQKPKTEISANKLHIKHTLKADIKALTLLLVIITLEFYPISTRQEKLRGLKNKTIILLRKTVH